MHVFLSAASGELEPYLRRTRQILGQMGWRLPDEDNVEAMDLAELGPRRTGIEAADKVLLVLGWRRGKIPSPDRGGDGRRSRIQWELQFAYELGKEILVLMADDSWPAELRESDPYQRAAISDLRGELDRLALYFDADSLTREDPSGFDARLRQRLRQGSSPGLLRPLARGEEDELYLRSWPRQRLPERPYPLLLPYTQPELFGGRERELFELQGLLRTSIPILGIYAASGVGKSSLLAAGLIPGLRHTGWPAASDRHPDEPGLARRLIGDLLETPGGDSPELTEGDAAAFVDLLRRARRLGGDARPPVLVLDQVEALLRTDRRQARAQVGILLAASVQRQPGLSDPLCRWILCYRSEFHGEMSIWLGDVLKDTEELPAAETLPHDLSGPERFHSWPMPPLGAPPPSSTNSEDEATHAFLAALETPLKSKNPDGSRRYPWTFAGDGAQRLARAFGKERCARLDAPLLPELQVVLAHLMERAEWANESEGGEPSFAIEVPEDPGSMIREALEDHLRRALDSAFPGGAQEGRTRALLALGELADISGRRAKGLPAPLLARAIGPQGSEILEKLATPLTRLVILEKHPEGWSYALSHDRMAQVIARAVEDGRISKLAVDADLLFLRRFVALKTELYRSGEPKPATRLPGGHFKRIAAHAEALIWDEDRQSWWEACKKRRQLDRRRLMTGAAALALGLLGLFALLWTGADRHAQRNMMLDQIASGEPQTALLALDQITGAEDVQRAEAVERLLLREHSLDILERGVAGIAAERRPAVVLRVVKWMLPLLNETPEDPFQIAPMVWALDFFPGRDPELRAEAGELRDRVLAPMRHRHPPPPRDEWQASEWANVRGGTFVMGAGPSDHRQGESVERELPRHKVTLSSFRMMTREVVNEQYRRLFPQHLGRGDLPAVQVNWYDAYTYAAWLGGRLPTEAEWEYAARAGCAQAFCDRDGAGTSLDTVGWYSLNAADPETMEPTLQPPAMLEPNRWGIYDLHGGVWEWTADGFAAYPADAQVDPIGAPAGGRRVQRGGSVWSDANRCRVSYRNPRPAGQTAVDLGFRVVLPGEAGEPPG